ncbi:MAG: hypothetical protein H6Q66_2927 [Firmicutes bacterium]|nr:hypothetical protein [Bacillota bacterium]
MRYLWGLLLGMMLMMSTTAASANDYGARGALQTPKPTLQEMLNFAIQDEYLAKAQYSAILDTFGKVRPFSNIVQAEGQHIAELQPLFNDRGLDVPSDESKPYVVNPQSLADAMKIGEQAEIDNIAMYEHFLRQPDVPEDVKAVFSRLLAASQRHLNAFRR